MLVQHVSWLCWCASKVHKTIEIHGEGLVETCYADGLGAVKDKREAWTDGPRWPKD